tara:strand:- start:116 stop:1489 length:1374 start_codon:yes stop_codon:yes gene_type:complete
MALIDELLVGLGFKYDPKEIKQFKDDIGKTTNILKSLAKAAIAGAGAITALTVTSAKATDVQGKLASEIGETVDNIDALQFANQIAGGTVDGMSTSLRNLALRASEASRGMGSGLEVFGLLGIEVNDLNGNLKPTSALLLEISDSFQDLSKARQIEFADKLGLSDSVLLLQEGKTGISDLITEAKLLGTTTAEDAAIAAEFNDSLTKLWQVVKSISRALTRSFAPAMKEANDIFTDWWKLNGEVIKQKLPEWIEMLTKGFKLLSVVIAGFIAFRLVGHLLAMVAVMKGLTISTLALNAAVLILPALIGLLGLAFVALVEDAKTFFEGGDSFIGDMLNKFPQWTSEIEIAASVLATVAELTGMIFDGWSSIIDLFKSGFSFEDFKEVLGNIPGFLGDITGISPLENRIPELNGGSKSSTNVEKIEINVPGAGDPQAVATAILDVFNQTSQDLNSAVDQ